MLIFFCARIYKIYKTSCDYKTSHRFLIRGEVRKTWLSTSTIIRESFKYYNDHHRCKLQRRKISFFVILSEQMTRKNLLLENCIILLGAFISL